MFERENENERNNQKYKNLNERNDIIISNERNNNYISSELSNSSNEEIVFSRYQIYLPINNQNNNQNNNDDNNKNENEKISQSPIERRKKRRLVENSVSNCIYITIQQKSKTSLEFVGEQLWRGSLILSDYLIWKHNTFENCVLFELGSGVGFLSIIASHLRRSSFKQIYMTDYDQEILDLGNLNIDLNNHIQPFFDNYNDNSNTSNNQGNCRINSRVLNWYDKVTRLNIHELNGWSIEDQIILNSNEVLWLAADVIYDESITESFFQTMSNLMNNGEHLLMSVEKRFNFTIDEMSLIAHGYNKFLQYIHGSIICEIVRDNIILKKQFVGKRISLLFPQYIEYDRVKDIEMWDIQIINL